MTDTRITLNADERKALKEALAEVTNSLSRIDAEKEQIKDIIAAAEEKFNLKKRVLNKLARTMYKHNYADLRAENEHFEYLYEAVAEGKKV